MRRDRLPRRGWPLHVCGHDAAAPVDASAAAVLLASEALHAPSRYLAHEEHMLRRVKRPPRGAPPHCWRRGHRRKMTMRVRRSCKQPVCLLWPLQPGARGMRMSAPRARASRASACHHFLHTRTREPTPTPAMHHRPAIPLHSCAPPAALPACVRGSGAAAWCAGVAPSRRGGRRFLMQNVSNGVVAYKAIGRT
jgi:hypothetical protein